MASAAHKIVANAIDKSPLNRGLKGADWLARSTNIPIVVDRDVMLFDDEGDRIYQAHVLFESRGRKAIERVRAAFRQMFVEHDAAIIFAMVPAFRRDVAFMARWSGMRSAGDRMAPEGPGLPLTKFELFVLSRAQWKVANQ